MRVGSSDASYKSRSGRSRTADSVRCDRRSTRRGGGNTRRLQNRPRTPAEPTGPTCGDLPNTHFVSLHNEHVLPYRRTAPHPSGRNPTDDTGEQARCSERTNTTDAARPTTRYQPGYRYSRTVVSGPDDRAAHRRRHTAR